MTERTPNHLRNENSPYLLQHAFNPVDWHPWGIDSLNAARDQDKLLIISIGYAACHWCHVMEHESFEDVEVATLMNRDYMAVKVDREERPDIDQVYMAAAYVTSGRGGWPLNVIALPDQRPIFAGTYFSRTAWLQVLHYFSSLYKNDPEECRRMAADISKGMKRQLHLPLTDSSMPLDTVSIHEIFTDRLQDLDFTNGGTRGAPKFPMPANLESLLNYGVRYNNQQTVGYVYMSLEKMAMGGIFDQLGGGFSRYSVDSSWHVPHFEKMLYDNAQLLSLCARAYACRNERWLKEVVSDTVAFIHREMMSPGGLFFASLDADSEGREGTFYAWTAEEIRKYLGDDAGPFLTFYSCSDEGNWESGLNVLRKAMPFDQFCETYRIEPDHLTPYLEVCRDQLMTVRNNRERPAADNKILTSWNGLMISALTTASRVFGKAAWLESAIRGAEFYRIKLEKKDWSLWRNTTGDRFFIDAFLDDYCFLATAFLDLYQATLDEKWLEAADALARKAIGNFTARDGVYFNLAQGNGTPLVEEVMELSDNVMPASNSAMARNLLSLGHLLGNDLYLERCGKMLRGMLPQIRQNPSFHANWTLLLLDFAGDPAVVTLDGKELQKILMEFSSKYLPGVLFTTRNSLSAPYITTAAPRAEKTTIIICRNKTCSPPVESVEEALKILNINTLDSK